MFCIKCHSENTKVINSRPHKKQASIWRRRRCQMCGTTFTTLETVASEGILRVRHGDTEETFSLPTLMISIYEALKGSKNAAEDAYWLATTVFEQIMSIDGSHALEAHTVSETAYNVLRRYRETAALKYGVDHNLLNIKKSRSRGPRRYK